MDEKLIDEKFWKVIEEKGIYNKLSGITENQIYNWRHHRGIKPPSIGDKLGVLFQLNLIVVNESKPA